MKEPYAMNQTKFISRRTFLTGVSAAAIAAASPAIFAAPKPKAKALIILFSRSGNTAYLAERIHAETGAPILRIEPKVPYAPRYSDMTDGAREEIRKWSRREIKTKIPDLSGYDTIFICAPLWWGHLDTPMRTFHFIQIVHGSSACRQDHLPGDDLGKLVPGGCRRGYP